MGGWLWDPVILTGAVEIRINAEGEGTASIDTTGAIKKQRMRLLT
jgi:hypothetical protein